MPDGWPPEPQPWPVVPRPFLEEPIGGWLGRVAARYRMSVGELVALHGLDLGGEHATDAWLLISAVSHATIRRLGALARVEPELLQQMLPQRLRHGERGRLRYCARCLFLNPTDVMSPRWLRTWLDDGMHSCDLHGTPLRGLTLSAMRGCRNFDALLRQVSRLERTQDCYSGRRETQR